MTTTLTALGWSGQTSGQWTFGQNSVTDTTGGITLTTTLPVNTLGGGDRFDGSGGSLGFNIAPSSRLTTGNGDVSITGTGTTTGVNITGRLFTGTGNDTVIGTTTGTSRGIYNSNTISTSAGNDLLTGDGGAAGTGITNMGLIDTGDHNDAITAIATAANRHGLLNGNLARITAGNGDDVITGSSSGSGFYGIYNADGALIDTGAGNDVITGHATSGGSRGIYNFSSATINTGLGNDTVDALTGGFWGMGKTLLGDGDDQLKGFGTGLFDGGAGINDQLWLVPGVYTISADPNADGYYAVATPTNTNMFVKNFELIVSAFNPGETFNFSDVFGQEIAITIM